MLTIETTSVTGVFNALSCVKPEPEENELAYLGDLGLGIDLCWDSFLLDIF